MDTIIDPLIQAIQNFLPNILKNLDWGLNAISIILVWLGLLPGSTNSTLAGLGFLSFSYVISSFSGGPNLQMVGTDVFLIMIGGVASLSNWLARIVVAAIVTYVCLKRIQLDAYATQALQLSLLSLPMFLACWLLLGRKS